MTVDPGTIRAGASGFGMTCPAKTGGTRAVRTLGPREVRGAPNGGLDARLETANLREARHPSIERQSFQTDAAIVVGDEPVEQSGAVRRVKCLDHARPTERSDQAAAENVDQGPSEHRPWLRRSDAGRPRRLHR